MRYYLGIDVGSSATKGVLLDATGKICGKIIIPSGLNFRQSGTLAQERILQQAGITSADLTAVCSTGYGRKQITADLAKTEIACHAAAAWYYNHTAATLIDIGGQDAKVIHLDNSGRVVDFKMNRSCAAGTGSFLEELARRANIALKDLPVLASQATREIHLNSYCTVFAASELIAQARAGTTLADLSLAAYRSVVERVKELSSLDAPLYFSGGVVEHHPQIARLLSESENPQILPESQLAGAFGAALFAKGAAGDR